MKVLVTGATGFLGSHLCRKLHHAGFQVTAMCRPSSNLDHLNGLPLARHIADLTDAQSLRDAVAGQDFVIHAAADIRYHSSADVLEAVNIRGTESLAIACRRQKVRRLVYISSVAAIGIPSRGIVADEKFRFNLEGAGLHYHLSKKKAEEIVLSEVARGLDAVIVNPGSVFGPYGSSFRGGEMVHKVRYGALTPYFTGGICTVHVEDVALGVLAALERGAKGERYILGGENLTYRQIAERSAAMFHLRRCFVPVLPVVTRLGTFLQSARFSRTTHYTASRRQFYSSEKARRELDYRPRGFEEILQECAGFRREPAPVPESSRPAVRA